MDPLVPRCDTPLHPQADGPPDPMLPAATSGRGTKRPAEDAATAGGKKVSWTDRLQRSHLSTPIH